MASSQTAPIRLFVVDTGWGVPFRTSAPFPLKLETWLRMTGLRYELVVENDTRKGPKRKTPWIEDGDVRMGDSELIIGHLRRTYGVDPDVSLGRDDRAIAIAWQRTFEEHYHQAFEHQLLLGRGGAERLDTMTREVPFLIRSFVRNGIASQLRRQLDARGLGRHDEDTILAMGRADLDAASAWLEDRAFVLGDTPHTVDATAFGFLGTTIFVEGDNPLFRYAASLEPLRRYTQRMQERFFPETLA